MIWRTLLALLGVLSALATRPALAHEMRPAYLELRQSGPETYDVLWKVPARGDLRLALYPRFPEGCTALAEPVGGISGDAYVERARITRSGGLDGQRIGIAGLETTFTDVLVRVERADGSTQTARLTPVAPAFVVEPPRGWLAVSATYARIGIEHILTGIDHLLFVLGLLLIVRDRWMLLKTITSFTLAHSLTLGAATLGYASAPAEPLNAVIALSILFLGPEIVRAARGGTSLTIRHPWLVAFAFGLLHGFGFASGLSTIGLPSGEIPLALLSFNVGVEVGQLGFVALILLLARAFRVLEVRWPRPVEALPAYTVGSLGAYWTLQRVAILFGGA